MDYNATILNAELSAHNAQGEEKRTLLNQSVQTGEGIAAGTVLCEKYVVSHRMDVVTGEADLYICRMGGASYVAKVYRRRGAIKPEVSERIKSLHSPYIAPVYETAVYGGCFLEILPFYPNGSLQGKTFDVLHLKQTIIPCLNEGLHLLHSQGIIHKDLKPSNIMDRDDQEGVAIIDFGISSLREGGNTIVMTVTGMTPEYSAPETFRNLYLEESDYYSLGITIYELFCGNAPFQGMGAEEIERYVSVQKIPFPKEMPGELRDLISALTYYDITNRKDKTNPNRRWGYDEVKRWCNGEKMMVPGTNVLKAGGMPPYILEQITYIDMRELIYALAKHWEEGKKHLFRGFLSTFFKSFDRQAAAYCMDAEEEAGQQFGKEELSYWKLLYQLLEHIGESTGVLFWRGRIYPGLAELGRELLTYLRQEDAEQNDLYGSMMEYRVLSAYIERMDPDGHGMAEAMRGIEASYRSHYKKSEKEKYLYICGCMLTGDTELKIAGKRFTSLKELTGYMIGLVQESSDALECFCSLLADGENNLHPQLESWLIALGKEGAIARWREAL